MVSKYTYPRVTVSATANQHSSVQPPVPDTTIMFIPIVTKKGPNSVITPIHSLSEFISIFGDLDYGTNGQMALNLYNWLRNGGTAYVYRLAGDSYNQTKAVIKSSDAISEWKSEPTEIKGADGKTSKLIKKWHLTDLDDPNIKDVYFIDPNGEVIIYKNSTGIVSTVYNKKNKESVNLDSTAADSYYFIANGKLESVDASTIAQPAAEEKEDPEVEITETEYVDVIVPYFGSVDNLETEDTYYKDCLFIVNKGVQFGKATAIRYTEKNKDASIHSMTNNYKLLKEVLE